MKLKILILTVVIACLPTVAFATTIPDPLTTGWTFSSPGSIFGDNGDVGGHRQLSSSATSISDFGQIENTTVTGLTNGTQTVSVTFQEAGGTIGSFSVQLFVDGVLLDSQLYDSSHAPQILTGSAVISGGQADIKLKVLANNNIGPNAKTWDIYALSVTDNAAGGGSTSLAGLVRAYLIY